MLLLDYGFEVKWGAAVEGLGEVGFDWEVFLVEEVAVGETKVRVEALGGNF